MSELFDLKGRVCVVVGGTKGMGAGTVERMLEHGAKVVLTSREKDAAEAKADELSKLYGDNVVGLSFDLARRETGKALIQDTMSRFGRIDSLMCNGALMVLGRLEDMGDEMEVMDASFQSNVRNYAYLTREVIPIMQRQGGGAIIFILSNAAFIAAPPFLPYGISKIGLDYMTRALAAQYGKDNIRVNAIAPGSIATGRPSGVELSGAPQRFIRDIPLSRRGTLDDIAGTAILLSARAGEYITGQTILIDGGMTIKGADGVTEGYDIAAAFVAKEHAGRPVSD